MFIIFLAFVCISSILLFSLRLMRKRFDSLEIFIHLLFTSYFCQQFFYMLSSPYERLRVVEEHFPFWSARLQYGVIFPVLLMWVLYFLRGPQRLSAKVSICFLWVAGGVLIEKLLLVIGVLESESADWYPWIDFVLAMIVLSCSIYFLEILPGVLRKEKMIKHEKDI